MERNFNHLTWDDRVRLETMLKCGVSVSEIARELGFHKTSIYREMKRGQSMHLQSDLTYKELYSAEIAERKYRESLIAKGAYLKIRKDHELAEYIKNKIANDKYSPAAVLMDIERRGLKFQETISVGTIYNYIKKGVFPRPTYKLP